MVKISKIMAVAPIPDCERVKKMALRKRRERAPFIKRA